MAMCWGMARISALAWSEKTIRFKPPGPSLPLGRDVYKRQELGFGCEAGVRELLEGWREIEVTPDLAGIPRVIAARAAG